MSENASSSSQVQCWTCRGFGHRAGECANNQRRTGPGVYAVGEEPYVWNGPDEYYPLPDETAVPNAGPCEVVQPTTTSSAPLVSEEDTACFHVGRDVPHFSSTEAAHASAIDLSRPLPFESGTLDSVKPSPFEPHALDSSSSTCVVRISLDSSSNDFSNVTRYSVNFSEGIPDHTSPELDVGLLMYGSADPSLNALDTDTSSFQAPVLLRSVIDSGAARSVCPVAFGSQFGLEASPGSARGEFLALPPIRGCRTRGPERFAGRLMINRPLA